jgi:signal transduction histidine kinase
MLGFQTPVVVVGGTGAAYFILMLLTLRRRGLGSWLHGLLFLYLLIGIVWTSGKALAVAKGVVPAVPVYGAMIATDALAILPILLTVLTLLFFERPGAQRIGQIGIGWVAFIALADSNVLGWREFLQNGLHLDTPDQTVNVLVLTGWVGFTGGALVLAIWDYIRIQRPLHRNRILYWVAAILLIGTGEGLTLLPSVEMTQVGAFTRLMGMLLMAYVTLTYFLPDVRNAARHVISASLITLMTAVLFLGSFVLLQSALRFLPSSYVLVGAVGMAVLLSLVFQPLRRTAASLVDRLLKGEGYDPARALRDYSAAISSVVDLETLAQRAIGIIGGALEVRRGALLLTTEYQDGRIEVRVIPGTSEVAPQIAEFDPNSPILARLHQDRQRLSQYEIDILPEFRAAPGWERAWLEQLKMELYVPIHSQTLLVGILALGGKAGDVPYTTQDLNVLSTLADQTAAALQNARLVSDLKRLNDELTLTNRRLEKLDAAKTHFIQIASHELRTPLTQVRGYADVMADAVQTSTPTPAQMAQISQGISRATVRLEEIISAMLDVSQIDAEALSLRPTLLSVSTVVRMAADSHQDALKARKQILIVDSLEGLPSIQGDLQRLCQAFSNIIGNCIKFTPDGGSIHIAGRHVLEPEGDGAAGDYVEVTIRDTGIGIDPDDHDVIFEKFYRVGSPDLHSTGSIKFKGAGPGLGLSIARGVIQAHGGKVWVESTGHDEVSFPGSTFHILLLTSPTSRH